MPISLVTLAIWVLLPGCNFLFWYLRGHDGPISASAKCESLALHAVTNVNALESEKIVDCDEEPQAASSRTDKEKKGSLPGRIESKSKSRRPASLPLMDTTCARLHVPTHSADSAPVSESDPLKGSSSMFSVVDTVELDRFRSERMASMTYGSDMSVVIHSTLPHTEGARGAGDAAAAASSSSSFSSGSSSSSGSGSANIGLAGCKSYDMQWIGSEPYRCFAVVKIQQIAAQRAYAIQRFDQSVDENNLGEKDKPEIYHPLHAPFVGNAMNKGHLRPIGFFRKIPAERGFQRTKDKLGAFVKNHNGRGGIASQLDRKLKKHAITAGTDVTLMVVNEGEIDLWLNWACSCQQNGISLRRTMVFAASEEIIPLIESTGAMGLYHVGYASVSKKASTDYLDRVFVDMMWYKAFSVHLLTGRGINVLFQDVDLVWFKDPMKYFHEYEANTLQKSVATGSHPEAFFSDDGQRSLRYSPFFANSGFYYLKGTPRSQYFSWSIMISFDAVQVLGSHQNVFTMKLVEGLALGHQHAVILPIYQFPTGILYHHDRKFMRRLKRKEEDPYGFHMCWTQGKPDKLKYLRKASMWYLTEQCSPLENLIESGSVFQQVAKGGRNMRGGAPVHGSADTGAYGGGMGGVTHDLSVSEDVSEWAFGVDTSCCTAMPGGPGLD